MASEFVAWIQKDALSSSSFWKSISAILDSPEHVAFT